MIVTGSCLLPLAWARPFNKTNYHPPRSWFALICRLAGYQYLNGGCFSAKATWLIEWLCSLAGTVKVKSRKLHLASINSYQLDLGLECAALADPRLKQTIHGITCDDVEPEPRIRTAQTRPHLLLILRHHSHFNFRDVGTRAAFTLASTAFL